MFFFMSVLTTYEFSKSDINFKPLIERPRLYRGNPHFRISSIVEVVPATLRTLKQV